MYEGYHACLKQCLFLVQTSGLQVYDSVDPLKCHRAESQNHRMVDIERDFWKSSSPAFLLKQGLLKHITQDSFQAAFE